MDGIISGIFYVARCGEFTLIVHEGKECAAWEAFNWTVRHPETPLESGTAPTVQAAKEQAIDAVVSDAQGIISIELSWTRHDPSSEVRRGLKLG